MNIPWSLIALVVHVCLAVPAITLSLLKKRDPRAALGWIAVCVAYPIIGPTIYYVFGRNRVRTRAKELVPAREPKHLTSDIRADDVPEAYAELARIGRAVTGYPLTAGNGVEAFHNGEAAYPAMLADIASAERSVYLSTYIFDSNGAGRQFVDALSAAAKRGVNVLVLVDGIGERYGRPRITRLLRQAGVRFARFLPPRLIPPQLSINLRTHRKVLIVDDQLAWAGGMNIGDRHLVELEVNKEPTVDMNFRIRGPVVEQLEDMFLTDWHFSTGEKYVPVYAPDEDTSGDAYARVILDGPNEDMDKLPAMLIGAIAAARESVLIMTPYFLPPRELVAALEAAALRGVRVDVVLPANNNLPFVHWASLRVLPYVIRWGVNVYLQPGPFVHTKLFVVDDHYVQVGSANLDPRSLRLNFEVAVEIYDEALGEEMHAHFDACIAKSELLTQQMLDEQPFWKRLRNGLFWLGSPYL